MNKGWETRRKNQARKEIVTEAIENAIKQVEKKYNVSITVGLIDYDEAGLIVDMHETEEFKEHTFIMAGLFTWD